MQKILFLYRSMYASILSMVAFSFERYIVICHRVRSHTMSGLSSAIRIISGLWIVSLIGAIPFAVFTNVITFLTALYYNFREKYTQLSMFYINLDDSIINN